MIETDTLPCVDNLMDRQKLVGWIVRDAILSQGIAYVDASRRWPISLPTLNRLMITGNVGIRFIRTAERNLGLPRGLLEMVLNNDLEGIRGVVGLDETMRTYILTEMGDKQPASKRRKNA